MKEGNNLAVKEIREKLNQGKLSLFEKQKFSEYLTIAARFPQYSQNNQILIWCQDKNATLVCGYKDWQAKFNRHVIKGGKGIKVLAPRTRMVWTDKKDSFGNIVLDPTGNPVKEKRSEFLGFCTKTVFDVSQTAGDPIPGSITSLFSGKVDGFTELVNILSSVSPAPIQFGDKGNGYDSETDVINVKNNSSQKMTMQSLLPAIASAALYKQTGTAYEPESLESESVALIVAKHIGIDSADYDFDYITDWCDEKSLDELSDVLKVIHSVSVGLIKDISKAAKAVSA